MKEARKATVEFCKEIARDAVSLTPEQTRQFSLNEKVRTTMNYLIEMHVHPIWLYRYT